MKYLIGTILAVALFVGLYEYTGQTQNAITVKLGTPATIIQTSTSTATNNIGANTLSNYYTTTIDASLNSVICLEASGNLGNTGVTNITFRLFGSIDGVAYETNATHSWGVTPTSTTPFRILTNITVGSTPFFRVAVTNGNDSVATNIVLRVGGKR